MKKYEYFVIRCNESGEVLSTDLAENRNHALALANSGIGTINHTCQLDQTVDRRNVPSIDIAEETVKFLQEVIKGRERSTSPQCLPTGHYRKLVDYVNQFTSAKQREDNANNE